jgi:monoamine oxidase
VNALGRRRFLAALAAGAALPAWAPSFSALAQPTNPDVVVIGAGAAGIAACRKLAAEGLSFVLLEAKGRIGGRAFTDPTGFDVPFDHGCSWLHQSDRNPLTPFAQEAGFTLLPHDGEEEAVFVGDRPATEAELRRYGESWSELRNLLVRLGSGRKDVAPESYVPMDNPWMALSKAWIGPLSLGADFDAFSALDWYRLESTRPNLMVREGIGTLVSLIGRNLQVSLSTPVERIAWGGRGVEVKTSKGTIAARAAIVTVSTGVLQAERIVFDPPLPIEKLQAIDGLPMGLLAKIPLQFDGERYDIAPNTWLSYRPESDRLGYFLAWPFDSNLMIGFVGGRFGWALSRETELTAIDFALGELQKMFGSAVRGHVVKGGFTRWATDPDVLGSYAHQKPGWAGARQALGQPLAGRLFFAGEATAGGYAMTCGGAFRSGERAAVEALKALEA